MTTPSESGQIPVPLSMPPSVPVAAPMAQQPTPADPNAAIGQALASFIGPIVGRYAPWLLAAGVGFGGYETSASANANYLKLETTTAALLSEVKGLREEQGELRKEVADTRQKLADRERTDAAAVARAQAERHEERLRAVEDALHEMRLDAAKAKGAVK